jgi:3-oxo-4-pregnene-20-carboxyl-CoA dehydrogenase beta subunit
MTTPVSAMPQVHLTADERMLLRTSVRRMLDDEWGTPCEKSRLSSAAAGERTLRSLAELGLTDLAPAEGSGGLVELLIAMEELGRSGCPLALHASYLMRCAWPGGEPPAWLDDVRTGRMRLAVALPSDRDTLRLEGALLSGTAAFIEGYLGATHLVILGCATGQPRVAFR